MAGLFKNQIVKRLSRYAKDLSTKQLEVSTLKGTVNLSNLVLDEVAITNLLELPEWMQISQASCNRVTLQIAWTSLKTKPIRVTLDEVYVEMLSCEELRSVNEMKERAAQASSYGFVEKVIDGIHIIINLIEVNFYTPRFHVSIHIDRFEGYSTTPSFRFNTDLSKTRITSKARNEVIVFKQIGWQMMRLTAAARHKDEEVVNSSAFRVIASARIGLVLKKSTLDCSVIFAKLKLKMDDLLCVLTDSQLVAAIGFVEDLHKLIHKANSLNQAKKGKQKLEKQKLDHAAVEQRLATNSSASNLQLESATEKHFTNNDIAETSYHIRINRMDFHICDETKCEGSMQVKLFGLAFDHYPFHLECMPQTHWQHDIPDYDMPSKSTWLRKRMGNYFAKGYKAETLRRLMSSTFIIRLSDLCISPTTTSHENHFSRKNRMTGVPPSHGVIPFIFGNKKMLHLPPLMNMIHIEFVEYFYPEPKPLGVPSPSAALYCCVNPIQFTLLPDTMKWLAGRVEIILPEIKPYLVEETTHTDVFFECIMARLYFPLKRAKEVDVFDNIAPPEALIIHLSGLELKSGQLDEGGVSKQELRKLISTFPVNSPDPDKWKALCSVSLDTIDSDYAEQCVTKVFIRQIWIESEGSDDFSMPLLDNFPLHINIIDNSKNCHNEYDDNRAFTMALLHLPLGALRVQISAENFFFLIKSLELLADTVDEIEDSLRKAFHGDCLATEMRKKHKSYFLADLDRVEARIVLENASAYEDLGKFNFSQVNAMTSSQSTTVDEVERRESCATVCEDTVNSLVHDAVYTSVQTKYADEVENIAEGSSTPPNKNTLLCNGPVSLSMVKNSVEKREASASVRSEKASNVKNLKANTSEISGKSSEQSIRTDSGYATVTCISKDDDDADYHSISESYNIVDYESTVLEAGSASIASTPSHRQTGAAQEPAAPYELSYEYADFEYDPRLFMRRSASQNLVHRESFHTENKKLAVFNAIGINLVGENWMVVDEKNALNASKVCVRIVDVNYDGLLQESVNSIKQKFYSSASQANSPDQSSRNFPYERLCDDNLGTVPCRIEFVATKDPNSEEYKADKRGCADVNVRNLSMGIPYIVAEALGELIEGGEAGKLQKSLEAPPIPMKLNLTNVSIKLHNVLNYVKTHDSSCDTDTILQPSLQENCDTWLELVNLSEKFDDNPSNDKEALNDRLCAIKKIRDDADRFIGLIQDALDS